MNRDLVIILRTCSSVPTLHGTERYIKTSKHELINFCLSSLVNSINLVLDNQIKLIVVDDHSSEESKKDIRKILSKCFFENEFIEVEEKGPNNSCKKVYELIEKNAKDLWYHVEDDYLHFPNAIQQMINAITYFEKLTKINIGIFPYDCVCRYRHNIYPSYIFHGPDRHYRTIIHSTYTCMTSKKIFDKYKFYFDLAAEYVCKKGEDETINNVWKQNDVTLFSPIPSLAFHIVGEDGKDPYIDVKELWNSVPKMWL